MIELKETIEKVSGRVKTHESFYRQNEMGVRDQIIAPLMRGLEWDTENPDELQTNVSTEEGVPDYSLFKDEKKCCSSRQKNYQWT